jgi:uridine kinase
MVKTIGRAKKEVRQINELAVGSAQAFMAECDEKYEEKISSIVGHVADRGAGVKVIMLSGPSASGKTTTSLKIKEGLEKRGVSAVSISMDDFFKPRELEPLLPDGSRDYESLDAIDTGLLLSCLTQLINDGRAQLPTFNFKLGRPDEKKRSVVLPEGSVAVVEGLHALDNAVTGGLPPEHTLKLYVSASSDFVDGDGGTVLTARDIRLIRRTIRDYHFRGSSPENTLGMWESVCRGEDMYVRPFKRFADVTVNSVFDCEPCLFRQSAMKLFGMVPEESPYIDKARGIVAALSCFEPMQLELLPPSCVLREFVGGSVYYNRSGKLREV